MQNVADERDRVKDRDDRESRTTGRRSAAAADRARQKRRLRYADDGFGVFRSPQSGPVRGAMPDNSRRAAAASVHTAGESTGAVGASPSPANGLTSALTRLETATVTASSGSSGAFTCCGTATPMSTVAAREKTSTPAVGATSVTGASSPLSVDGHRECARGNGSRRRSVSLRRPMPNRRSTTLRLGAASCASAGCRSGWCRKPLWRLVFRPSATDRSVTCRPTASTLCRSNHSTSPSTTTQSTAQTRMYPAWPTPHRVPWLSPAPIPRAIASPPTRPT